jgi:hypothetical protein
MKAYVGSVDRAGLRWFLPEGVMKELLRHEVRRWLTGSTTADWTHSTTAVWALLADEDAEAIRADLSARRPGEACNLLLNRAVELLPLGSGAPDLADGATS